MTTKRLQEYEHEPHIDGRSASLTVSVYDRVSALLISLLFLVGFVALILFLLWLTSRVYARRTYVPVDLLEEITGRMDHAMGSARDLEPPGVEELPDINEPQFMDTLDVISNIVNAQQTALQEWDGDSQLVGKGSQGGDARAAGPIGEGEQIIPRGQRWRIQYENTSRQIYAQQLDYFGVELGAVGPEGKVEYLSSVSKEAPDRRAGFTSGETRLYMSWLDGQLKEADQFLMKSAGIKTQNQLLLHFLPQNTEDMLARAEKEAMGNRHLREVQRTIFGVQTKGTEYAFFVIKVRYRQLN